MKDYNHDEIEAKWQSKWIQTGIYEPDLTSSKHPFYNLMMFPYPSAEGLHVGNMYAFVGSDIYGRLKRMQGYNVFEPIGLDGFGIHSENYAMKIGKHPVELSATTQKNFYRQLALIGNGFAWSKTLETYDPLYYRWTQWIFIQLFKAGLAYRAQGEVNWCPSCLTVLADEQVIKTTNDLPAGKAGKGQKTNENQEINVCERCGTEVVKKKLTQWYFRITKYAQKLLDGLDKVDWSEKVSVAQRNWMGKSEGAEVLFSIDIDKEYLVPIFTTRPDTLYGVTFLALAVDHSLVTTILKYANGQFRQAISEFLDYSKKRQTANVKRQTQDEGNGVFTGVNAKHPLTGEEVPVYLSDYVLTGYGTGAVMGVPAHDQRDFEFAKRHGIKIKSVVAPEGNSKHETVNNKQETEDSSGSDISHEAFTQYGKLVDSEKFSGLSSQEAISAIVDELQKKHLGKSQVNWHLRDWIISRQRYWGPPIPMIFCDRCAKEGKSWFSENAGSAAGATRNLETWNSAGWYPVPDEQLPVKLPYIEKFKPSGSGVSPLAQDNEFVNTKCPGCGGDAKRETDVSDTFLDSSWYFLRYPSLINSKKDSEAWNAEITKHWLPVDMYIGGAEHAVLHLLYARFITKVFYDLGLVDFDEPFSKFRAHGLLIKDGAKMSKSKGNVVNPDDYIAKFGADTLRAYLMFCGRYSEGGDFRDEGIEGMHKFLKRVWRLVQENFKFKISNLKLEPEALYMMHKTIKKVTEDIEDLSYNTAIAALMEWMNFLEEKVVDSSQLTVHSSKKTVNREPITKEEVKSLLLLLAPFAPHMTEELWQLVHSSLLIVDSKKKIKNEQRTTNNEPKNSSIHLEKWPEFREALTITEEIILVVQVNGKVRDKIMTNRGITKEEAISLAKKSTNVSKYIGVGSNMKIIYIPEKIVNFVVSS
jgi:leucyl-tRNA synthetase